MPTEVRVPALGESVTEATVATWFKKPGDAVAVDEMLCELETDKVTVEVPSPAAGVLAEIVAAEGETVSPDALLAQIDESGQGAAPKAEKAEAAKEKEQPQASDDAAAKTPEGQKKMSGKSVDVMVPALGESVTEATVATWFKKVGDSVAADEMLCELETDKVSVEVPAPAAGVLAEIIAEEGATVDAKAKLAVITEGAEGDAPAPAKPAEKDGADAKEDAAPAKASGKDVEDAPSAKKAMAEKGVSRDQVTGSGRDGRVMKEDVAGASAAPKAAVPATPRKAEDTAREERVKMTRLRQTIARRLKDAQNTAAMLTTYNEADMSGIMELRNEYKDAFEKKHKVKLGFMSFFVKACVHALHEVPEVNAEIDGTDVVYKNYVNMGIAVGTPNGLVVPVVRDAQDKSFAEIEKEIGELGAKGRDGKLSMADMQGGTFTISNGGVYGSLMSSPILNPPQSGILGMHKIQERPVAIGGEVVIRPMMYLALSYDHRIVDGKGAVTFLVRVKEALEDPRRLLMDL
ncbi:2-oxoglutarate dehydrogenase complex dihydrolipoyllysine-residue succinyltransferase [Paracoccus fistulariae]|uniref:Dihydrolipoyllysine-residue succinyltransferase component of 2-oxoglutarate dehydrogenase complex n=1 Tax=Paracoccus fistulariae TaxID=658446 RepID=A0ABY7SMJ8_9RHOB|nr:2-oxoglutarate dehydrogenase complex dihydrolipoyllysine-residue succinyltransferase [Paracoccus fistulariae]MDB6180141.1 2-oxoglutarate dehydrogenase complex dihydrolipoyllysine-residue succinyltransferase [Paracoccus fistulariae]WCR08225.1 2-oxoglutarate dehydrogenase complex dihydrolipoyllysine-residue succinyltransferase [Paracoccus fistulariae]